MSGREAKLLTEALVKISQEAHGEFAAAALKALSEAILAQPEKLMVLADRLKAMTRKVEQGKAESKAIGFDDDPI